MKTQGSFFLIIYEQSQPWQKNKALQFSFKVETKQQQIPYNLQSAFWFVLIHEQLQIPAVQAQTKTLYSLFNKLT